MKMKIKALFVLLLTLITFIMPGITHAQSNTVSFTLSPVSATKQVNDTFSVQVGMNAGGFDISGVDIRINFNNAVLEMVNFQPSNTFNSIILNDAPNNSSGTFRFIAVSTTTNQITGNINLGTIQFRAKASGTGQVTFGTNQITASGQTQAITTAGNTTGSYTVSGTSANSVSLTLSPGTATKNTGENFDVQLGINAGSFDISAVDVLLNFDKNILELVSFQPSNAFGSVIQNGPPDNSNGNFRFIGVSLGAGAITGNVNVGTLKFKGKASGTGQVTFGTNQITASGQSAALAVSNNATGSYIIGSSSGVAATTQKLRIAESRLDLDRDGKFTEMPYTYDLLEPPFVTYALRNSAPGVKQIWVKFIGTNTSGQPVEDIKGPFPITVLGSTPEIGSVSCNLNLTSGGVNVDLKSKGSTFGTTKGKGKVKLGDRELTINSWNEDSVKGILDLQATNGQTFQVTLTRDDGEVTEPATCTIGVSQIQLGTKLFCRSSNQRGATGVEAILADGVAGGAKVTQTVSIGSDGVVTGLKGVQEGKPYRLSVKAPGSLRKVVEFCAAAGTTEAGPLKLSVGDISPEGGDGVINSADYAELLRQWAASQAVGGRSGDLNTDSRVNSFDWACMKPDFNRPEDPKPTAAASTICPSDQAAATAAPTTSPTPSPTPTPNP